MVSTNAKLKDHYEQIIQLMQEQLTVLEQSGVETAMNTTKLAPANEQLDDTLRQYNQHALQIALLIEQIDSTWERLEEAERPAIAAIALEAVTKMQQLSVTLEQKLAQLQQQSGTEMNKIQQNRKVLRSYGGLDMQETTSVYFDEKN